MGDAKDTFGALAIGARFKIPSDPFETWVKESSGCAHRLGARCTRGNLRHFNRSAAVAYVEQSCEYCGAFVPEGSIRPWACSDRCYAQIMGIEHPDY